MPVNDLDDDILEELKSINNLLERIANSNEQMNRTLETMMNAYSQTMTRR